MIDYSAMITITTLLVSPLFGLIIYFFKRIDKNLERNTDRGVKLEQKLELMSASFTTMKADIEKALVLSQRNENLAHDIDSIKKDIKECRRDLDALNLKIKSRGFKHG